MANGFFQSGNIAGETGSGFMTRQEKILFENGFAASIVQGERHFTKIGSGCGLGGRIGMMVKIRQLSKDAGGGWNCTVDMNGKEICSEYARSMPESVRKAYNKTHDFIDGMRDNLAECLTFNFSTTAIKTTD